MKVYVLIQLFDDEDTFCNVILFKSEKDANDYKLEVEQVDKLGIFKHVIECRELN